MNIDFSLFDLILRITSTLIILFGIWAIILQYTSGRLISQMEIRLHYFRNHNGKRILYIPPLGEPKIWEVVDIISALWIMFRARAWAKNSEGGRILYIPNHSNALMNALLPTPQQLYQRLRIHLQLKVQQPDNWVRRGSGAVSNPDAIGDEMEYQAFLSIEHGNPEAKAIYVHILALETVDEIVASKGEFASSIHSHWAFTEERIQILEEGCKHLQQLRSHSNDENNLIFWL